MKRAGLLALAAMLLVAMGAVAGGLMRPGVPRPQAQAPAVERRAVEARLATEERLRARLRIDGALMLRAVQIYRQAMSDTLAVCGQVNPNGRSEEAFIPFVVVVGFEEERVARGEVVVGASSAEAGRVYLESLDKCFDGGGPATPRAAARPLAPIPTEIPRAAPPLINDAPVVSGAPGGLQQAVAVQASPVIAASVRSASGGVTTTARHPVNIRSSPSGGGAVVRVAPRNSTLQLFGEAPGGWLQVGEGEPWGWLHASMVDQR